MTFINITFAASAAGESLLSSADSVVLNIPDKKFDIRYDINLSATISSAFTEAKVKLNGADIDTISAGSGETYEIIIGADVTKYIGENKLSLDVTFADSSKKQVSGTILTYSPVATDIISTDMTKAPSDFPAEGSFTAANVKNLWKNVVVQDVMHDDSWDVKKNVFKMVDSAGEGVNEKNGKFMQITHPSGAENPASIFTKYDSSKAITSGKIRVIYNMLVTSNAMKPGFNFRYVGGNTNNLYTMDNLIANVWNKITLEYDLDTNKIYYCREADGATDYIYGPSVWQDNYEINVNQLKLDFNFTETDQSYFIESINIEHLTGQENSLLLTSYNMPDSDATPPVASKVHADAKKLTLTASDDITSADGLDIISETGEKIEGITFTTSGKNIEVTLPDGGVPSGAFKIVLGKNTKLGGRNVPGLLSADVIFYQDTNAATSAALKVGEAVLTSAEQITSGSVIKADITSKNNKNAETKLVYVLTVRDGSRLVSMKAKSVTLPPLNEQPSYVESFSLTLPAIAKEGNYKVYLMAIDSYENCVAIDNCLAIE